MLQALSGNPRRKIEEEMKADRGLTVEHMVKLGGVSRANFYRFDEEEPRVDRDMDLRDAIQRVALKWPSYGRPRITAELKRQGWKVGPNRVRRIMREDNLLCVQKRKFMVTTDSNHGRKVYPNLKSEMELSGINNPRRPESNRLAGFFAFIRSNLCTRHIKRSRAGITIGQINAQAAVAAVSSPDFYGLGTTYTRRSGNLRETDRHLHFSCAPHSNFATHIAFDAPYGNSSSGNPVHSRSLRPSRSAAIS